MKIEAYLQRINYTGSLEPTSETLRELHRSHLLSVPFENLSIHAGEPIILDDDALFDKIVENKRGGFCYEANGLFAALLRALGFDVAMLSAGVANAYGKFGPDFDHMTLMVSAADSREDGTKRRWLADVGFGDSFLEPLRLDEREQQVQGNRAFRIIAAGTHFLMERNDGDEWKPQYRFSLQPYSYPDYEGMCHYHQTSSQSHFTKGRICSRATASGRITLSQMRLITTSWNSAQQQVRQERELADEVEYARVLREQFGIVMKV